MKPETMAGIARARDVGIAYVVGSVTAAAGIGWWFPIIAGSAVIIWGYCSGFEAARRRISVALHNGVLDIGLSYIIGALMAGSRGSQWWATVAMGSLVVFGAFVTGFYAERRKSAGGATGVAEALMPFERWLQQRPPIQGLWIRRVVRLGLTGAAAAGGLLLFSFLAFPAAFTPQFRNAGLVNEYANGIVAFERAHDRYPHDLAELRATISAVRREPESVWGFPLLYLADAAGFLLIDLGRDGRTDGSNYLAVRREGSIESICGRPDADWVLSERGAHRFCGK